MNKDEAYQLQRTLQERISQPTLREMSEQVYAWCKRKGWEPSPGRTFGDEMALLHTEISEAVEAYRANGVKPWVIIPESVEDKPWWQFWRKAHVTPAYKLTTPPGHYYGQKPEGVPSEFADVLIRLLHECAHYKIDLFAEFDAKMRYNEGRPWRHGNKSL